jgi:hypothetical protein
MAYLHGDHLHFIPAHSRVRWDRLGMTAALAVFWLIVAALVVR